MRKKVTMDDIAKELGVSRNTVSMSFRQNPLISEKTRQLVFDTARNLGYEYKSPLQNLTNEYEPLKNICLILSKKTLLTSEFFSNIIFAIEDEATKNGFNVSIHFIDGNNKNFDIMEYKKNNSIIGVMTLGSFSIDVISSIINTGLSVVMVDSYFHNIYLDYILTDNQSGGYIATEYLIRCGHKDIAFMGDYRLGTSHYDRFQGYKKALRDNNIPITNIFAPIRDFNSPEAIQKFIASNSLPTAIVCQNDRKALTLCKNLTTLNIKIPDDISVIGFDDIDATSYVHPALTTLSVDKELMGREAVKVLLEKIEDCTIPVKKISFPAKLIERESVKKM